MMVDRRTVTVPRSAAVAIVVAAFIGLGVLAAIGMAWFHQGERLDELATGAKQQAKRNTELLLIECDLETGKPGPPPGKRYLNDPATLDAHCTHQKDAAARVSGYIGTIKEGVGEQVQTSENNLVSKLDEVKAAVERRPLPVVKRVPIPRPTSPTSATKAPRAGGSPPPPAAPPSTVRVPPNPPQTTTTTCPKRGRSEKCR